MYGNNVVLLEKCSLHLIEFPCNFPLHNTITIASDKYINIIILIKLKVHNLRLIIKYYCVLMENSVY